MKYLTIAVVVLLSLLSTHLSAHDRVRVVSSGNPHYQHHSYQHRPIAITNHRYGDRYRHSHWRHNHRARPIVVNLRLPRVVIIRH